MEKLPEIAPNGARRFCFLLVETLPTIWAEHIWILRIVFFLDLLNPKKSGSPGSRFPNFQKSGLGQAWAGLGLGPGRAGLGLRHLDPKMLFV